MLASCPGEMPGSHYWPEKHNYFAVALVIGIRHAAATVVDQGHREFLQGREEDLLTEPIAEQAQLH